MAFYFDTNISGNTAYFSDPEAPLVPTYGIVSASTSIVAGTQDSLTIRDPAVTPTTDNVEIKWGDDTGPAATIDAVVATVGTEWRIDFTFPFPTTALQYGTGYDLYVEVGAENAIETGVNWVLPTGWSSVQVLNPDTSEGSVFYQYTGDAPADDQQIVYETATDLAPIRAVTVLETGEWQLDGVPADGDGFDVFVIGTDNSVGTTATIAFPDYPSGTITIGTITTTATTATIPFTYNDTDVTGYEYRIDGGSWTATTSPISLTGLTESQTYAIDIHPLNGSWAGTVASDTFTALAAVDVTPDPFTPIPLVAMARQVYATFAPIVVTGVDPGQDIPVSITNGEYSVSTDGGTTYAAWTTTPTNVRLNYRIRVRHLTANTYDTDTTSILDLASGAVTGDFVSTTIPDAVAPVISLTGGNMSWVQGTPWVEPGYTAIDNGDGDITNTGVVVTGSVDVNMLGNYTLTYTATDSAGNSSFTTRLVTVVAAPSDTIAPVISVIGGNPTLSVGDTWVDPGATAVDDPDGDLTNSIIVTGSVNTSIAGQYTLTYSVTDAAGNTGTATRLVTVRADYPISAAAPAKRTYTPAAFQRLERGESVYWKQPVEVLDYDFDLASWLTTESDTLDPNSIQISAPGLTIEDFGVVPSTSRVKVWISGGANNTSGKSYKVELTVSTTGFRTAQFEFNLVVIDV